MPPVGGASVLIGEFGRCSLCTAFGWQSLTIFDMYSLRSTEFDDVCYVQPPIGFDNVRLWSLIGGVVDEVRLQAPVGGRSSGTSGRAPRLDVIFLIPVFLRSKKIFSLGWGVDLYRLAD
ncbi:hypothetical protein H5410_040248 [Solanum commersonii]|uniref:Uncharacterized protein n=1 Tax=Solanum commersonii TaxID=4109 RepID=A0A9J5XRY3_SOLCO|nr:hypothetical protein H5410_040248 [Solanum commersonii]